MKVQLQEKVVTDRICNLHSFLVCGGGSCVTLKMNNQLLFCFKLTLKPILTYKATLKKTGLWLKEQQLHDSFLLSVLLGSSSSSPFLKLSLFKGHKRSRHLQSLKVSGNE